MKVNLKTKRLICSACRTRTKGVELKVNMQGVYVEIPLCIDCLMKAVSRGIRSLDYS